MESVLPIPDNPPIDTPPIDTPAVIEESAFQIINKQLGYDINYEGDETVEGMANYAKLVVEHTQAKYEKTLQQTFPELYQALVYAKNGGNPADLFQSSVVTTVDTEIQAEKIIRESLKDVLNTADIDLVIKAKKDSNTLLEDGKKIFAKDIEARTLSNQEKVRSQEALAKKQKEQETQFLSKLTQSVTQGILPNLTIPESVRKEFATTALQSLRYNPDGTGYEIAIPVDITSLEKSLQALYFHYANYDIDTLVKQRINTQQIKRQFGQALPAPPTTGKGTITYNPLDYQK